MDPNNLQNNGQGVQQQTVPSVSQTDMGYQYPRMPQMQNILGPPMNTFVPGYSVMPQGQGTVMPQGPGTVMTNMQAGMPVGGFLSIGNSNGSGPLPSMGSFIASLNQPPQVGMVQSINKGGIENWTGQPQNNNTLPSFGHFLLHQQYQQQPTNPQTLIGNQTSPQQQVIPTNQPSSQQVFSPNQHSPQFFQQSPQMYATNQHSPQQVFINNQPSAHFFPNPQHSPQFFSSTLPHVFTGQPSPHQLFTNPHPAQQQMINACELQNRFPTGQIVGQDILPQVMATQRMNMNTNYIAGVNNILGVTTAQVLPPINQIMTSAGGHVLPSIGNVLQGQTLPSFNHVISPYSGNITPISTSNNQILQSNMSAGLVSPSTTTLPHLINTYSDKFLSSEPTFVIPCCNQVTITTPTITTTVSRTTTESVMANIHFKSSSSPKVSSTVPMETEKSKPVKTFTNTDSRTVIVPFGWSRVVVDNSIIYYSPSNVPLKSPMDIAKYLTTEGTCKCGLECPILINKVFNFDIGILSKMWTLDVDCPEDLTKLCNHKRKVIAMATFHTSYSVSSSTLTDTISVNSLTGGIPSTTVGSKTKPDLRKKPKGKTTKASPYDGLLVSQLIAQRDKNKQNETDKQSICQSTETIQTTVPMDTSHIESTNHLSLNENIQTEHCNPILQTAGKTDSLSKTSSDTVPNNTNESREQGILQNTSELQNVPNVLTAGESLHDTSLDEQEENPQNMLIDSTVNVDLSENTSSSNDDISKISDNSKFGDSSAIDDNRSRKQCLADKINVTMDTVQSAQSEEKMDAKSSEIMDIDQQERRCPNFGTQENDTSTTNQGVTIVTNNQRDPTLSASYFDNQQGNRNLAESKYSPTSRTSSASSSFETNSSTKTTETVTINKNQFHTNQSSSATSINTSINNSFPTTENMNTLAISGSTSPAIVNTTLKETSTALAYAMASSSSNSVSASTNVSTSTKNGTKGKTIDRLTNKNSTGSTDVNTSGSNIFTSLNTRTNTVSATSTNVTTSISNDSTTSISVNSRISTKSTSVNIPTYNMTTVATSLNTALASSLTPTNFLNTTLSQMSTSVTNVDTSTATSVNTPSNSVNTPIINISTCIMSTMATPSCVNTPIRSKPIATIDGQETNIVSTTVSNISSAVTSSVGNKPTSNNNLAKTTMNTSVTSHMNTPVSNYSSTNTTSNLTVSSQSGNGSVTSVAHSGFNTESICRDDRPESTSSRNKEISTESTKNLKTASNAQTVKGENSSLRISVADTIVTSILSSINSARSHEHAERKQASPKKSSPKTQKTNCNFTQKSPKHQSTYDSFPLYQVPQMRYPLNHGPPGSQMNPFGISPFGQQFMSPGVFNFPTNPYPMLSDTWVDPKKITRKRSPKSNKKEKVKKKVNSVYDSDTPPPNVDVSQLKDHGKGPIPKVSTSVSFLDDPSAFLAEQTVLISSSLTSNLCSPTKKLENDVKEDKNDTVDGDVKSSRIVTSVKNKTSKVTNPMSVSPPYTFSSASHGMVVTSSTQLSKVNSTFNKHWGIPIPISESHSILGCSESEMFTEDRCESLSPDSGNECPSVNEMITPSSVVHHPANKQSKDPKKTESQLDKIQNDKIMDILAKAKKKLPAANTTKKQTSKNISLSPLSHPASKTFTKRSAIQQILGNANSLEFPASTLLSAAARAQMTQQNLGFTSLVNPSVTQTQYGNQMRTSNIVDNVTSVYADGPQPSVTMTSSIKSQGKEKTAVTQSDIVSGHESVAKLLRQPVNLNITNSLKGVDAIGNKTNSTEKSTLLSTPVLSIHSKVAESVPIVTSSNVNITSNMPVVSNMSNSFQHILPNLSGLGQPLLNVIGNNIGMNLLPNGQVILPEQSGISQNNVQCIPLQNEPSHTNSFLNLEGRNQNINSIPAGVNLGDGLQNKGITLTQVLPTEARSNMVQVKPSDLTNLPNLAKIPQNCDPFIQQQNLPSNNGQMVVMPNLHMPLMQFLGSNSMPVNVGLDKAGIPQVFNPADLQLLNGQLQMGLSQPGSSLNVMNVQQQVWNNLNTGNLTAMQLQTLQLQQQLLQQIQQLQDMQSIISQFSLHGNSAPMTTDANRDVVIATKENQIPGKSTPETMVSIVSTTCQESPGNGEDGPSTCEEKGTSTDFDEEDGEYYNSGQEEEEEITSGDVADTTCHILSSVADSDNIDDDDHLHSDELEDCDQFQPQECGATDSKHDNKLHGANMERGDASLCHIDCYNEPVNLVSRTKHSEGRDNLFLQTVSSNVASSSSVMSSSNNQSKSSISSKSSSNQKYLKCSPEHSMSTAEKPSVASLPSDVMTSSITSTTPINLCCHSDKSPVQNIYPMEVDSEVINLSQKRYLEEEKEDVSEAITVVKDLHDFTIGDLVWGQIRGFPSWPGKVVHESEVYDAEELEPGKCWVKWFGDHTFTQVEMLKLKTLTEGLEGHQKSKKKNKKGRKMNSNLEAAIHEALIELDKQTSLAMEMKLKPKGKIVKKKRIK